MGTGTQKMAAASIESVTQKMRMLLVGFGTTIDEVGALQGAVTSSELQRLVALQNELSETFDESISVLRQAGRAGMRSRRDG